MIVVYTILWIIAGLFLAIILYIAYQYISYWISRKFMFLTIGLALIFKGKDPSIKEIGWQTLGLFFWESTNKKE